MNSSQTSLKRFFFEIIKPHKGYVISLFFIAFYWGLSNSFSPYVLKLIIDKAVAFSGDKSAVFHAVKPYVILYILL